MRGSSILSERLALYFTMLIFGAAILNQLRYGVLLSQMWCLSPPLILRLRRCGLTLLIILWQWHVLNVRNDGTRDQLLYCLVNCIFSTWSWWCSNIRCWVKCTHWSWLSLSCLLFHARIARYWVPWLWVSLSLCLRPMSILSLILMCLFKGRIKASILFMIMITMCSLHFRGWSSWCWKEWRLRRLSCWFT